MTSAQLIKASARAIPLADESVQTVITSPPYFGLRQYAGEQVDPVWGCALGAESTPDEYVSHIVEVMREVRRVLRRDGTLWLNLGDSYAAQRGGEHMPAETLAGGRGGYTEDGMRVNRDRRDGYSASRDARAIGLKHKDLVGIPWMVAFALRADGWWLRSDIIWHKPNPMPESVRDRPTKAHEYLFLLSKQERYYYDAEACAEPLSEVTVKRVQQRTFDQQSGGEKDYGPNSNRSMRRGLENLRDAIKAGRATRNRRTVWAIPPKPYRGAHFATFPPALVEPCVLAGSRPGDVVLDPFVGSGTTGIVAVQHGRSFVGLDVSEEYLRDHAAVRIPGAVIVGAA